MKLNVNQKIYQYGNVKQICDFYSSDINNWSGADDDTFHRMFSKYNIISYYLSDVDGYQISAEYAYQLLEWLCSSPDKCTHMKDYGDLNEFYRLLCNYDVTDPKLIINWCSRLDIGGYMIYALNAMKHEYDKKTRKCMIQFSF